MTNTGGGNGYFALTRTTSPQIRLYRMDSGSLTSLGTSTTAPATGGTVTIAASGGTITVSYNGTQIISATDATYTTGATGFILGQNIPTITDWSADGVAGGTPPAVSNYTSTASLAVTPSMSAQASEIGVYRSFGGIAGPSSASSVSGPFLLAAGFHVTSTAWMEGFWWWVATNQNTAPQAWALWQETGSGQGQFTGQSGTTQTFAAGWNFVQFASPVQLTPNIDYRILMSVSDESASTNAFTQTTGYFGNGSVSGGALGPGANGIANGPLVLVSSGTGDGGTSPSTWNQAQNSSKAASDPTASASFPSSGYGDKNFWLDPQVTTSRPSVASYRLFPNMPVVSTGAVNSDVDALTHGTRVTLTEDCTLNRVWFYSGSGAQQLPSDAGIFNYDTQAEVVHDSGLTAADWSGPVASGWVSHDFNTALPAGTYVMAVAAPSGSKWFSASGTFYSTGTPHDGTGVSGLTAGPVVVDNSTTPTYTVTTPGPWTFPSTPETDGTGWWLDLEVSPAGQHAPTASLSITPAFTAAGVRAGVSHSTAASLQLTPAFTAISAKAGVSWSTTASLNITPALTAQPARAGVARSAAARLSVTPSLHATGASAPARKTTTASVAVTPVLLAASQKTTANGYTSTAQLTIDPLIVGAVVHARKHQATASLIISPGMRAYVDVPEHPAASVVLSWNVTSGASVTQEFAWNVGKPVQVNTAQMADVRWISTYPS